MPDAPNPYPTTPADADVETYYGNVAKIKADIADLQARVAALEAVPQHQHVGTVLPPIKEIMK